MIDQEVIQDRDDILSMSSLPINWDGQGSLPISSQVSKKTADFVVRLWSEYKTRTYFYEPGPNGEISIVIGNDKRGVEFLFYPSRISVICFEGKNLSSMKATFDDLDKLISWINHE